MRSGITEKCWNNELSEFDKLRWNFLLSVFSIMAASVIQTTPYPWFNALLKVCLVINTVLIIHVQRKFQSYTQSQRRRLARGSAYSTLGAIRILGFAFFGAIFLGFYKAATIAVVQQLPKHNSDERVALIFSAVSVFAIITIAILRSISTLRIYDLIVTVPRTAFIECIFARRFDASSAPRLYAFEASVILFSYLFCHITAITVDSIVKLFSLQLS